MNEGIIAVRQTAKAARYGLIPSVTIIGATIVELVIIATVALTTASLMMHVGHSSLNLPADGICYVICAGYRWDDSHIISRAN